MATKVICIKSVKVGPNKFKEGIIYYLTRDFVGDKEFTYGVKFNDDFKKYFKKYEV